MNQKYYMIIINNMFCTVLYVYIVKNSEATYVVSNPMIIKEKARFVHALFILIIHCKVERARDDE